MQSQEEFIPKVAYLADIFDSLNSLNLSMQGAGFTVIEQTAKVAAYHKKLALWKSYATRGEYDRFPELKHYLCDKEVNIKQTVIGHLEMLAQKFEDYCGEALTPSDENDCILDPIAGTRAAESQRGPQGRIPLRAPCQLQSTLGIVIQKGNTKSFKLNSFYFAAVNALNLIKLRKSSIIM